MNAPPAIRIILAGLPGLMGGVVRDAINGQPDMGIVGEFMQDASFTDAVSTGQCDIVVGALSPGSRVPAAYQALLFGDLPVPFMVLDPDGRRLQAYARSVRREFAGTELVAVIRRLARPEAESASAASIDGGTSRSRQSPHVL